MDTADQDEISREAEVSLQMKYTRRGLQPFSLDINF